MTSTPQRETALLGALTTLMSRWSSSELLGQIAREIGVSLDATQVRAIYMLGLQGGAARPSALATELHLTRPTTSKLLSRLSADGLVAKTDDPSDGRASRIELTARGEAVFGRLLEAGHAMVLHAMTGWPTDDADALTRLLTRFVDGLIVEAASFDHQDVVPATAGASPADRHERPALPLK